MKIRNAVKYSAVLAILTMGGNAIAQNTASTSASITVSNSITLNETQAMSFGSLAAVANTGVAAIYTVSPTGSTTVTNNGLAVDGRFVELTPGQPGIYDVTGGPVGQTITVTVDSPDGATDNIIDPLDAGGTPFTMDNFVVTYANNDGNQATADVGSSGELTITVGADLTTDVVGASTPYNTSNYLGTLRVVLAF